MQRWLRLCWPPLLAAGVLVLVLVNPYSAQDKKHSNKDLYNSLRDVINTGADMFNLRGDHGGCYRVYQGALLATRPFVPAEVQKEINAGLAKAEQLPSMADRAFELRRVIDLVRSHLRDGSLPPTDKKTDKKIDDKKTDKTDKVTDKKTDKTDKVTDKKTDKKVDDKKDVVKDKDKKVTPPKTTLWDRLGGEDKIAKIVDDFVIAAGADPKVNVSRNGKFKPNPDDIKVQLIAFISQHTGGPYKYTGRNMKEAHKGMGITNAEFDAAGAHFKKSLEKHKVGPDETMAVMDFLGSFRKDIVEGPKKTDDSPKKDAVKKDDSPKKDSPKEVSKDTAPKDGKTTKDAPAKDSKASKDAPAKEAPAKDAVNKDGAAIPPPVKTEKTSKLSGKATLSGKAIELAYVTFVAENDRKFTTLIKGGTYTFRTPIPVGEYRVYIEPAGGESVQVSIPERYRAAGTSGLNTRVESTDTVFDIVLKN